MAMARKRRAKGEAAAEGADDVTAGAPLFQRNEAIDHVAVRRLEPVEGAGYLGKMEPSVTEEEIKSRYGGGKYKLTPRDAGSQYVNGAGAITVEISGDPNFTTDIQRRRYYKNQGVDDPRAPAGGGGTPSILELMMLMDKASERTRAEAREAAERREREQEQTRLQREREAEASHQRQLELMRLDVDRREKDLANERDRLREQLAADRARDQQFMQTMLSVAKAKGEGAEGGGMKATLELLATAKELFGGGDGESDPLASLAANAPALMEQVSRMVGGGSKTPAQPPARNGKGGEPFVVEGELGAKATAFFTAVAKRGIDPAAFLNAMIEQQAKRLTATPATAAPPAANGKAPAAAPAPPPAPAASAESRAAKATPRPKSGTRKSALPRRAAAAR